MSLLKPHIHRHIYIAALALLAVSLPFSLFLLSISQFALIINWFAEGSVKAKFRRFFSDRLSLALSLFFFIHLIGLVYTSDFAYAFKDIRIKLPLLLLPLIIGTSEPLSAKELRLIYRLFVAAIFTATLISTYYYFTTVVNNMRDVSRFISHIRFSLMICLALVLSFAYVIGRLNAGVKERIVYAGIFVWLIVFLFIFESVTGLSLLILLMVVYGFYVVFTRKGVWVRVAIVGVFILFATVSFVYLKDVTEAYFRKNLVDYTTLDTHTKAGHAYTHDTTSLQSEGGNLVWIYICEEELAESWKNRSSYDFFGNDDRGQYLQFTLIRYLTSMGLRKDAEGVAKLSDKDIHAIEKGIPSVTFFQKMTLRKRIHEILWEYENYVQDGDASGLSVMMRVEFIRTAIEIIKKNFVFGVGTGDVNSAFQAQYNESNSLLKPEYRWRSHNQYLSVFVAFGLLGLICFLISLIYPPLLTGKFRMLVYSGFIIIIAVSMLTEDTLETQIGVTFFAFFNTLLISGANNDKPIK